MSAPLELGRLELVLGVPPQPRGKRQSARLPRFHAPHQPISAGYWRRLAGQGAGMAEPRWLQPRSCRATRASIACWSWRTRLGVHAPQAIVTGLATADLHVAGNWTGFAAPVVTGNLHLRSVTATIPGIAAPLQVTTAALHLAPDAAAIYDLAGGFAGTHLSFTGSLQVPRRLSDESLPDRVPVARRPVVHRRAERRDESARAEAAVVRHTAGEPAAIACSRS